MKRFQRREPELYDFYEELDIPYLASDERVIIELQKKEQEAIDLKDKDEQAFIKLAREYIGTTHKRRKQYDKYLQRHYGIKFPLTRKQKVVRDTIIGGIIVAIGLTGSNIAATIYEDKNKSEENNVCVEYTVEKGIGNKKLDDMFYEYGYVSYAVSGADRNLSPNKDNPFEGDIIVGRTTKKEADRLVSLGVARIISLQEAIELLGENHTLIGEFKKASEGESDIAFYTFDTERTKS